MASASLTATRGRRKEDKKDAESLGTGPNM